MHNSLKTLLKRGDVRRAMDKENIETRALWKPLHLQPVFNDCPYYGDGIAEGLFSNGHCLPSGASLTDDDIERVVNVLKGLLHLP